MSTTLNNSVISKQTQKSNLMPKWSEIMDSAPAKNQSEAFYTQLRPRDREQEIVGPLKLKVHSSLERVVN